MNHLDSEVAGSLLEGRVYSERSNLEEEEEEEEEVKEEEEDEGGR